MVIRADVGARGEAGYVAVVGAVNVDITGVSSTKLIYADSNPGRVSITLGGVGRNIAENLLRMGFAVKLVTALGDDSHAREVSRGCAEIGLDISQSLLVAGASTSSYLCVSDCDGEIAAAVNDMAIYESMTSEFLKGKLDLLNGARLVVLDANIPGESVDFLAANCKTDIVADPVSVKKAGRLKNSMGAFALIKPNRLEASLLTGIEIRSDEDLPRAAEAFFATGLKRALISLGSRGVYFNDGVDEGILACFKSRVLNTTGCGDAFLAGAAAGLIEGKSLREMSRMGLAASSVCAMSDRSVNPDISMDVIKNVVNAS